MSSALDNDRISEFVADWYRALDEHVELATAQTYLVDRGLSMTFPEGTLTTAEEFATWYHTVTHRFFDEVHEVVSVTPVIAESGIEAEVQVVVNWQAKIWDPPAPVSQWLGFDAYQTWTVVLDSAGTPRIRRYVVDDLKAMPGSTEL